MLVRQMMTALVPFYDQGTTRERSTFHLFHTQTIDAISGAFDHDFWNVILTRSMKSYKAVWHATLAVAALYERSRIRDGTDIAEHFKKDFYNNALLQYSKSIQQLGIIMSRKKLVYSDKEAILICNSLYIAICNLQGDTRSAYVHVYNGVRLFHFWKFWTALRPSASNRMTGQNCFLAILIRFIAIHIGVSNTLPWATQEVPHPVELFDSQLPDCDGRTEDMGTFYELQAVLILAFAGMLAPVRGARALPMREPEDAPQPGLLHSSRRAFTRWKIMSSPLLVQHSRINSIYLLSLRARVVAMEILLRSDASYLGRGWHAVKPLFVQGLAISRQLLALETESVDRGEKDFNSPVFSFTASGCDVLFVIGRLSHDRAFTLEALSLLKSWPRHETMWTTALSVQMLQAVIEVQNCGVLRSSCNPLQELGGECIPSGYICTNHKVVESKLYFSGSREGLLTVKTVTEKYLNLPGSTIKLSW